jgi:cellulose synthase (UDP-forming)
VSIGLRYEADAGDYPMIAELTMGDMDAVRAQRQARRRPRGMLRGGLTIVAWGLGYPFRAFRHLVFDRASPKVEEAPASAPVLSPAIAPASVADAR